MIFDLTQQLIKAKAHLTEIISQEKHLQEREGAHINLFHKYGLNPEFAADPDKLELQFVAERNHLIEMERAILTLEASQAVDRVAELEKRVIALRGEVDTYLYNAMEQRAYKSGPIAVVPTGAAYFIYGESGSLLGEYDANGSPLYESIYLADTPVALLKTTGTSAGNNLAVSVYNVYTDHLGTPRVVTRSSDEAIVWRWDASESYGGSAANQDPNTLGTFVFNQRFPGQVFDAETGLFQNWHREYNPRIGRYLESDPIGLEGGINTYVYVDGNPTSFVDLSGTASVKIDGNRVTVHKNDVDPWPSDPHGHVYDKNLVVDKDGNIYNKTTGKVIGQLSNQGMKRWLDFLKGINKLSIVGDALFLQDLTCNVMNQMDPGNPFCNPSPEECPTP